MKIEVTFRDKHGDWDGNNFDMIPTADHQDIQDLVDRHAHVSFGHSRIEIKVDGKPFNNLPVGVRAMQVLGDVLLVETS